MHLIIGYSKLIAQTPYPPFHFHGWFYQAFNLLFNTKYRFVYNSSKLHENHKTNHFPQGLVDAASIVLIRIKTE